METQSAEIKDLAIALNKVQAGMSPTARGAENPFYHSTYTDLAGLWESVRPHLAANGLSVVQTTDGDGEKVTIITTLLHTSGQWIRGTCTLKPVKTDPQGVGSAITYGRRYGLAAILGACSEGEDDDGNAASHRREAAGDRGGATRRQGPAPTQPATTPVPETPEHKALADQAAAALEGPHLVPDCPAHGPMKDCRAERKAAEAEIKAGTRKLYKDGKNKGKPVVAPPAWKCDTQGCKTCQWEAEKTPAVPQGTSKPPPTSNGPTEAPGGPTQEQAKPGGQPAATADAWTPELKAACIELRKKAGLTGLKAWQDFLRESYPKLPTSLTSADQIHAAFNKLDARVKEITCPVAECGSTNTEQSADGQTRVCRKCGNEWT